MQRRARTSSRYQFRNVWRVPATPEETYSALCRLHEYPMWWPEVKEVDFVGSDGFLVRCRSLLPYDLSFVVRDAHADPQSGILMARLAGDLEGYSCWTVTGTSGGSILVFDEEVVTTKPLLKRLSGVLRPALQANHALMMRHGEAGLRAHLAARRTQVATASPRANGPSFPRPDSVAPRALGRVPRSGRRRTAGRRGG